MVFNTEKFFPIHMCPSSHLKTSQYHGRNTRACTRQRTGALGRPGSYPLLIARTPFITGNLCGRKGSQRLALYNVAMISELDFQRVEAKVISICPA